MSWWGMKTGRPKGPEKVVYKRRIPSELAVYYDRVALELKTEPELIYRIDQLMDQWIKDRLGVADRPALPDPKPKEAPKMLGLGNPIVSPEIGQVNELKSQISDLLEDNDKLSKEIARLEDKAQKVARLTDNEKLILWIRKYDELKREYDRRLGGSEFSQ